MQTCAPALPAAPVPLTPAAAAAIALPAAASLDYKPAHRRRTKLKHWLSLADQLGVGYADLSLISQANPDASHVDGLVQALRRRISAVRLVLKRARSSEARRIRAAL